MHAETGRRIYFENDATIFNDGSSQVICHDVYSANIQPDDPRNAFKHKNIRGVYFICYIGTRTAS